MKQIKTIKTYQKLTFLLAFGGMICFSNPAQADYKSLEINTITIDSIGQEIVNGQRFLIHKLAPKETYYQLNRIYGVPVKDIMAANNKKDLRVGDSVRIPRGAAIVNKPTTVAPQKETVLISPESITEYKVGKSETLYAISKRFSISIDDIKKINNLTSNSLREGQILRIPNNPLPQPTEKIEPAIVVQPSLPEIDDEAEPTEETPVKANKYGIREKKERGIGVWLESLGDGETSLALHKTAPIGTILKITNPMNRSVTFAKVVGKFGDNQDTHNAIVVLSKSVASSVGALDRRFQIEITYGIPLE